MDVATLAALAGNTLITAAATDAWEDARHKVARLFGHGKIDPKIEQKLEDVRRQLDAVRSTAELEQVQADLARDWAVRLKELLADYPDAEAELTALVEEIKPAIGAVADHSVTAGRDVKISADRGSVASGVIDGDVTAPMSPADVPPRGSSPEGPYPRPLADGRNKRVLRGALRRSHKRDARVAAMNVAVGHQEWRPFDETKLTVTIYLADEGIHEQVEKAVDNLLASANLHVEHRYDPIIGSWFRRLRVGIKQVVGPSVGREAALSAAHALDSRVNLAQDATVTATLLQNLGPVIASLQPTKDAVLRVGALLIVKIDWAVQVFQLTAAQQAELDHRPQLAWSPQEIISILQLSASKAEQ